MRADGKLRPTYYPRGLVISSGEDAPKGHSLRARIFFVEVKKGDIETLELGKAQDEAAAGSYANAMAGYIRWLAPQMKDLKVKLDLERQALRTKATRRLVHRRTPDQMVSLAVGLKMFLQFGLDMGAITEAEQKEFWERGWCALGEAAARQAVYQAGEDPVTRFAELLSAAIASGRAHLAEVETDDVPRDAEHWGWRRKVVGTGEFEREELQPQGERIGWVAEDGLFLEPNAAYAAAQKLAHVQGDNLSMAQRTLYKRMDERGLLLTSDKDRNTKRRTVAGQERAVVHLERNYLYRDTVRNVQVEAQQDGPSSVRTFRTVTEVIPVEDLVGKTTGTI